MWLKRMTSVLFSFHWQLLWQEILDFAPCNCTEKLFCISSKNCLTLNYCLLKSKVYSQIHDFTENEKIVRENVTSGCRLGIPKVVLLRGILISYTQNAHCDLDSAYAVTTLW